MNTTDTEPFPAGDRIELSPGSIFCIGKNYHEHAREMMRMEGTDQIPSPDDEQEPIVFMKPPTALELSGIIAMPYFNSRPLSSSMHYEGEIVLLVGRSTNGCSTEEALEHIAAIGVGLDMTLRDVQLDDKKSGKPWLKSKGFKKGALVSNFIPFNPSLIEENPCITVELNDREVQHGCVSEMIHPPDYLIHYLSNIYGLRKGDIIFTGTPSGVGPVAPEDTLTATLWLQGNNKEKHAAVSLKARVAPFQ